MLSKKLLTVALAAGLVAAAPAMASKTMESIKKKGEVSCGVNSGLGGFGIAGSDGKWTGFDVDYCRAIAAAALGDANKVRYVPLSAAQRFTALQSGEIDVLARNTTWTMSRDTQLGTTFGATNFFDGQGFLVPKSLKVKSAKQLKGATICVQSGTTTEKNLADYFRMNKMTYKPVVAEDLKVVIANYNEGRCKVFTSDASQLAAIRANDTKVPDDHIILPEIISKEPLGPVTRQGDEAWSKLVTWVHFAMITAEELGVNAGNVDQMRSDANPEIQRLLGQGNNDFGKSIGTDAQWAYRVIKQVGNYGEVFERHVGKKTPLKLDRGQNALWTNGGLQYAPPIR
ncbi:HisJ ABC-type amino acid transport/signal transduction systems, periplasmic component/domain [Burkholderiales bacterium]|jgi:general L-amino acid transport system substrate-binding protein